MRNRCLKETLKISIIFLISIVSCKNEYIQAPILNQNNTNNSVEWTAPKNVQASQGNKESITLTWDKVEAASRYYIYKSDSPLVEFSLSGETQSNVTEYKIKVPSGSTVYYKVRAVNTKGETTELSNYVKGSSLAQPVITEIIETKDDLKSSITVYWYMNNVEKNTYKDQIRYIVYCYDGLVEVEQLLIDGAEQEETLATFNNLISNKNYTFQVKAYLFEKEQESEISNKLDAQTARRLRPHPVSNAIATKGFDKSSVEISFDLPELVDYQIDEATYEQRPLYFVVSRRELGSQKDYQVICPYFGSNATTASNKGLNSIVFGEYIEGNTVTYIDSSIIPSNRGVKYEYQIQSFVDEKDKIISSNSSIVSNIIGWSMSIVSLSLGTVEYTLSQDETVYTNAQIGLNFTQDRKDIEYSYKLYETIHPLEDKNVLDASSQIINEYQLSYEQLKSYKVLIDLSQQTSQSVKGRGKYSYYIEIYSETKKIETVYAIGNRYVSENISPLIVENFEVEDGYADKYIIKWSVNSKNKYVLEYSENGINNWVTLETFTISTADNGTIKIYEYMTDKKSGYFSMYATIGAGASLKKGGSEYSKQVKQLGVLVLDDIEVFSYDSIKLSWDLVQLADTYRIKYKYSDSEEKVAETIESKNLSIDSITGKFVYAFKPEGYNDAQRSGLAVYVTIEALNKAKEQELGNGVEIKNISQTKIGYIVGGGLLDPIITQGDLVSGIRVSWRSVKGAQGYYIVRRQYEKDNSKPTTNNEYMYYVNAQTYELKGKGFVDIAGSKEDTTRVPANISYGAGSYDFIDMYLTDEEYTQYKSNNYQETYIKEQNQLVLGYPYHYYIIPVLSEYDMPSFNYPTLLNPMTTCTVSSIEYKNISPLERVGYTSGIVEDINVTKGTYSSGNNINDGIKITWKKPSQFESSISPKYYVYRKLQTSLNIASEWLLIEETTTTEYIDTTTSLKPVEEGKLYEYVIGVSLPTNSSHFKPYESKVFMDTCRLTLERDKAINTGFIIIEPQVISASRSQLGNEFEGYHEILKWKASLVDNKAKGIDGYEVHILNKNIDNEWHIIEDISINDIPNNSVVEQKITNKENLLKILRDYKHYYRVRAYVIDEGTKIYSKISPYVWADGAETDYVKWGTRQLTPEEFIKATMLVFSYGLWSFHDGGIFDKNTADIHGDSTFKYWYIGSKEGTSFILDYIINSYSPKLGTPSGDEFNFLTISANDGNILLSSNGYFYEFKEVLLTISGPTDTQISNYATGSILFSSKAVGAYAKFDYSYNGKSQIKELLTKSIPDRRFWIPMRYSNEKMLGEANPPDTWWIKDSSYGWW